MKFAKRLAIGVAVLLSASTMVIVAQGQTHTGAAVGASALGMLKFVSTLGAGLADFYGQVPPGTPFGP